MSDGLHPVTLEELARLAVDAAGRLYWDGQQVETKLSLPWYVDWAIILAAVWPPVRWWLDKRERRRERAKG